MQLMIGARVDSLEMFMGARVREKISPPKKYLLRNSSLSLSLCIVILDSNFNRSEETFSNVPNLSFQEEFFSQYYTEYIPNLSRSSFHFRLISSINARVTRDNNNIQHVLRDANVTAPSFSLSLSLQLDPVQNALAIFVPVGIFNRAEFSRKTYWWRQPLSKLS